MLDAARTPLPLDRVQIVSAFEVVEVDYGYTDFKVIQSWWRNTVTHLLVIKLAEPEPAYILLDFQFQVIVVGTTLL
ncbi:unnamed protein product [Allacma fusca]|uniref:Uncharacterized protein n=1 Tax=Allacma fusca TaxID=39272 RepID=A0A8J2PEQ6_9HEXA|nr:unnamed protein product [Allacma fusca]